MKLMLIILKVYSANFDKKSFLFYDLSHIKTALFKYKKITIVFIFI